jgi:glycosyltransferase involved in cell wall biosynthesis
MQRRPAQVHCELGPVLINRTAVYKMCRALPGELAQRGFQVTCSALLARVAAETAEPMTAWDKRLFHWSRRWLHGAIQHPGLFEKTRAFTGLVPRWRQHGLAIFLDPLYVLFYGTPDSGVVLVYDITTVSNPDWHHPGVSRLYQTAFDLLAKSRCHLVASCQSTADELRVNWGIAPSRLTVLPLGLFTIPPPVEAAVSQAGPPFLLFVGNLEPRKNVPGLIEAYRASGVYSSHGVRLRIIGSLPGGNHPVLSLARSTPGVDLLGFVTDAELAAAYAQCLAFVYPSFCEGFGLPLLEAMHRGCVCLSTMIGASPEIAGDAALYVNPYSPLDIAQGLGKILALTDDERRCLSAKARERSRAFTWTRFYDGLAQVLSDRL